MIQVYGSGDTQLLTTLTTMAGAKQRPTHMTRGMLANHLASKAGRKSSDVRAMSKALASIAKSELTKTGAFSIPNVVLLKVKQTAASPAGKRMIMGREVGIKAKEARTLPCVRFQDERHD